ncbi:hypothetical protein HMPREF1153_2535 [Selenomonas sp. CM52]|nr:hypothetical protein HMPREF1153_2535 [Selenomonas sp. CM52]
MLVFLSFTAESRFLLCRFIAIHVYWNQLSGSFLVLPELSEKTFFSQREIFVL